MKIARTSSSLRQRQARVAFGLCLALGTAGMAAGQQTPSSSSHPPDSGRLATTHADSQEMSKGVDHLRGNVQVNYRDMKLSADEVTYNQSSGDVVASGHVLFIDARSHINADEIHYNLRTGKGWFTNFRGYIHSTLRARPKRPETEDRYYIQTDRSKVLYTENPFYIRGKEVERLDDDTYKVTHGWFSTCDSERKGWSFSASEAKIELDDKAMARGCIIRFLDVPLFYVPAVATSIARRPRHTGFLLPYVGNSSIKGYIAGGGFFWAISPSMDLLLGLEYYTLRGVAPRGQFRMQPSEHTKLTLNFFEVNDKDKIVADRAPGKSVKVVGDTTDLPFGIRAVADVDYVSSLAFRETYSPTFTEAVNSEAHQVGFASRNSGAYSSNFYASRYEDFLSAQVVPGNAVLIRHTPEFSFLGMDQQAGESPFYFSFRSSAGEVGRTEPGLAIPSLSERLDVHPEVGLRLPEFWGFHLTPSLGFDAARYGAVLDPNREPLTRLLGDLALDFRPPSLEKVFARELWGRRFKHVIEPDVTYRLVKARDPSELADVVRSDELDILSQTQEVEYSLTNIILARKEVPAGTAEIPQAQELLSWRITQKYYFDPTFGGVLGPNSPMVWEPTLSLTGFHFIPGRRMSPVVSVLKVAPFSHYDTEMKLDLSPYGKGILDAGITSHVKCGPYGLAFTDFYINKNTYVGPASGSSSSSSTTTSGVSAPPFSYHLLNVLATFGDFDRKGFSGAAGTNYNLVQKVAAGAVAQVSYNFGCFGLNFEYQKFSLTALRQERVFRAAISLANIGTFGDFKPRDRLY